MSFILITLLVLIGITILNEVYWIKSDFIKQSHYSSIFIHSLVMVFIFICLLIVFHRVVFSAIIALGIHYLIIGIHYAKYHALKEGMVFSDIVMFSQAFKHPRLYFPFVNTWLLISFPVLIAAVLAIALNLESGFYFVSGLKDSILYLAINSGLFFIAYQAVKTQNLSLNANQDIKTFGLLASITIALLQAQQKKIRLNFNTLLNQTPFSSFQENHEKNLADLIVVQSESFFDVRRLYPDIASGILQNYDKAKLETNQFGELNVSAWGANTMRTEFSFLTGLQNSQLGLFRYYPYHYIKTEVFSIARYLKQQGYYTVCVHPYKADFFERKRVFSLFGFDAFIDINRFENAETAGAYISDAAVTEKIIQLQSNSQKPLFVFAITMENHGPLHLESVSDADNNAYQIKPDFDSHDLSVYLRHLKNADQMIANLIAHFKQQQKPSCFCFYGDHVPSIPAAYQALQFENSQSDYFIWQSDRKYQGGKPQPLDVDQLGVRLVENLLRG